MVSKIVTCLSFLFISAIVLYSQGQERRKPIEDVAWSPSGDYIVVQREWKSWVYDANNLDAVPSRGAGFYKLVFGASDSRAVALTITGTGVAVIYAELDSDRPISTISDVSLRNQTFRDEVDGCLIQPTPEELAYSPSGERFARIGSTGGGDGTVFIYTGVGRIISTFNAAICTATDIAFSPDDSWIASTHYDGAIQILNVFDGALVSNFNGNFEQARALAFHPDGTTLAVLGQLNDSQETVISVFDVQTGDIIHQYTDLATSTIDVTEFLETLLYSSDGDKLITADSDGTIFIWDTSTHDLVERIENPDLITGFALSPDGDRLAYGGHEGILYVKDLDETDVVSELLIPTLSPTSTIEYPTRLPTVTPQPSRTPTATATPTQTPTATATPVLTPAAIVCADAPPTRLNVGMRAMVSISPEGETRVNLRVRTEPGGEQVASMTEGTEFDIIAEPVCFDGLTWWKIETITGDITGWSAEGFAPDDYFITPLLPE